ncbi:MAG: Ig-like domain-containing protein [Patescibacteria group bacterium]
MKYKNSKTFIIAGLGILVLAALITASVQTKTYLTSLAQQSGSNLAAVTAEGIVVSAQTNNQSSIKLTWSTGAPNTFSIERSLTSTGPFTEVTTVGKRVLTYTDNGLTPSTPYYYRIRSFVQKGRNTTYSPYSNVATARTSDPDTVSPTVSITSPQDGQSFSETVTVNASASDNVAVTKVELWQNGSLAATDSSAPYSFVQNIAVGAPTTFTFLVKAFDAANNSATSSSISITAVPPPSTVVTADKVLVVYNTNSPDSIALKDYYIANRPEFGGVNVLGVATDDAEITSQPTFNTTIRQPIVDWMQANTLKPIYYIVMVRGIPDRVSGAASVDHQMSKAYSDLGIRTGSYYAGGTGLIFSPSKYPGTTALVTHLNMGSLEATQAYIDKLKVVYNAMPTPNIVISGSAGGQAGTNYFLDEAQGYSGYPLIHTDKNKLTSSGVSSSRITYTAQASSTHITQATDVLGFETWGANGGIGGEYANNGSITFSGKSSWYLIKTIESFNGQWSTSQGNFIDWFSSNAFGGTNYSNTPIGATTHVEEPYTSGVAGSSYLADWEKGLLFVEAAWDSKQTVYFMAVGDPLITR